MYTIGTSRTSCRVGEGIMNMNKSFGSSFCVGCDDGTLSGGDRLWRDDNGGSQAWAVSGGMGGSSGGMGGSGGMAALSVSANPTTTTFGTQGRDHDGQLSTSHWPRPVRAATTAVIYYTTDATEVEVPDGAGGAGGARHGCCRLDTWSTPRRSPSTRTPS